MPVHRWYTGPFRVTTRNRHLYRIGNAEGGVSLELFGPPRVYTMYWLAGLAAVFWAAGRMLGVGDGGLDVIVVWYVLLPLALANGAMTTAADGKRPHELAVTLAGHLAVVTGAAAGVTRSRRPARATARVTVR